MPFQNKSSANFFEARYKNQSDPWNFTQSEYEQTRFNKIVEGLAHRHYRKAFEPGCSIGTLTERLATLADTVDAADFSPTAAAHATQRCAHLPNVHIACAALTGKTPLAGYDLIILSEIGYYFRLNQWRSTVAQLAASMDPGATVLASHWLGLSSDHRLTGDQVHEVLRASPHLQLEHEERNPGFRLDRFVRR